MIASKYMKLITSVILLGFFSMVSSAAAQENELKVIQTYQEDVTGDGMKETVSLKGVLLEENAKFYQELEVEIKSSEGKKWRIPLGGGYNPNLKFIDINHNGTNDIFCLITNDTSKQVYPYQAYTLDNGQLQELPQPSEPFASGNFTDNFIVHLQIDPSQKPLTIDMRAKSNQYIQKGIYNKDGHLLKQPAFIIANKIAKVKPVFLGKQQGYALKSYQPISGVSKDDYIGTIETLWYFENGSWKNMQTEWKAG
ncbi:hypothetical protein P5G51_007610 [Virgibacillus sp. 179-BFC.A HS]|uniref:VCBS repeat-containing protein n=1 Tax=Tigheibacillus jepli TaxID=3035914 RepID=A0ABU5CG78_9BACI|nr:hypothetical protein [Virgibacillus sp. 179-BFC.A HS]MDY0405286.1 hypothetical protein [Virgibacillus sp. 179-BFC.A HS]